MGACVLVQWLLVQAPLWVLAARYDLKIRHRGESSPFQGTGQLQFGIRQLMILTFIVAVLLGIGRMLVINFAAAFTVGGGDAPIFIFLAVAGVLMTLPLVLAALLPRHAVLATLGVLAFTAVATAWELPLMNAVMARGGPDQWHFIWINAFQAGWVLTVIGLLRLGGYSLAPPGGESPFASKAC
jgi:hypothetical protein